MNKKILFSIGLWVYSVSFTYAQFNDKYWLIGRHTSLDFATGTGVPDTFQVNEISSWSTITNICDRQGKLICWSDGFTVYNKNSDTMPNGSNFNHSTFGNQYMQNGNGNPLIKGAVIIPNPADTNKLFMFYADFEYEQNGPQGPSGYIPSQVRCLEIDRSLHVGLGDVTFKDSVLMQQDSLDDGNIFAIRHGNGKDWWVLFRKFHSNLYYKILIDSNGINPIQTQAIGSPYLINYVYHGVGNVSVDGTKIAYVLACFNTGVALNPGQIDVLDFDRCTGNLSNYKKIVMPVIDTTFFYSVCLSPNNRYLYGNTGDRMFQLDLQSTNPWANRILVAKWDGFNTPPATIFWHMKNGMDGKIYVSCYGSNSYMHVINNPDLFGTACNFVQRQLWFGATWSNTNYHVVDGGLPNTPNFALGAIAPCGNVGVEEVKEEEHLLLYPNPCKDKLLVTGYGLLVNTIEVTNLLGQKQNIIVERLTTNDLRLTTENLPSGIYFIKATDTNGNVMNGKFVKE